MKNKALSGLKITDADQGQVSAVFSTFGVVDSDGDVTDPGAFTDGAKVRISAYNHASWGPGTLPVGKGVIRVTDDEAILDGEFFLDTQAGRDTFEVVKQMDELQEWSYGYDVVAEEAATREGRDVNLLKELVVHEVSPVILGAGVNTRTLAVKQGKQLAYDVFALLRDAGRERFGDEDTYVYVDDFDIDESWAVYVVSPEDEPERYVRIGFTRSDDGGSVTLADDEEDVERITDYAPKGRQKLPDQLASVSADIAELVDRVAEVSAMRAEKGKSLGQETLSLAGELESNLKRLREVLASAAGDEGDLALDVALESERARFRL